MSEWFGWAALVNNPNSKDISTAASDFKAARGSLYKLRASADKGQSKPGWPTLKGDSTLEAL